MIVNSQDSNYSLFNFVSAALGRFHVCRRDRKLAAAVVSSVGATFPASMRRRSGSTSHDPLHPGHEFSGRKDNGPRSMATGPSRE